jgi:hypothetical protein
MLKAAQNGVNETFHYLLRPFKPIPAVPPFLFGENIKTATEDCDDGFGRMRFIEAYASESAATCNSAEKCRQALQRLSSCSRQPTWGLKPVDNDGIT